jgi:hypothetical protein
VFVLFCLFDSSLAFSCQPTDRLQYSIPKALARSIPVITAYRTVMAVTHSLVPSLTRILSHTSNSERFCYYCQHYQQHCSDCHYVNINSFNIQFYSGECWHSPSLCRAGYSLLRVVLWLQPFTLIISAHIMLVSYYHHAPPPLLC